VLLIGGLVTTAVVAYWPSSAALWQYWTVVAPSVGGHGPLVLGLALWLLYRKRAQLAEASVEPRRWALLLLLLCSIVSLIFWRAGIQALQLLMLPMLIYLAVLAAFGTAVARLVAVPLGYLYFAMPAWNLLGRPLQELTAGAVRLLAPLLGLPATVNGPLITFPNGTAFVVTPACSGVGFLVEGLAVAVLLGELQHASLRHRLMLMVSIVPIAIVTNWIRVLALVQIGYSSGMRHVIVTREHLLFGRILFVIVLIVFVYVASRRPQPPMPAPPRRAPQTTAAGSGLRGSYLAAVVALTAAPLVVGLALTGADRTAPGAFQLPPGRAGWQGPLETAADTWRPVFVGEHEERHVSYTNAAGATVEVLAIGYRLQEQGRELVNEGNSLFGTHTVTVLTSQTVEAYGQRYWELVTADAEGHRSMIWCIYDIGGHTFVIPITSQVWYGLRSLTARPYSVLFALKVPCTSTCSEARGTLGSFVLRMGADLIATADASRGVSPEGRVGG
jgi:EpsI family protein